MRINSIFLNNYPSYSQKNSEQKTTFGSQFCNRHCTCFFRPDINWTRFGEIIEDKYKDTPKVNVYNLACSDGSEAYSLAMLLCGSMKKSESQKFFPIKAYDINSDIISTAKSGLLKVIRSDEIQNLYYYSNYPICKSFRVIAENPQEKPKVQIKNKIKSLVKFEQDDIIKISAEIPPQNSVVMCRNVFNYLSRSEQLQLISNFKKLDNTSLVVIGGYDRSDESDMVSLLFNSGFCELEHNIFQKSAK